MLDEEILPYISKNTCKALLSLQKNKAADFIDELKELKEQGLLVENNNVYQIQPSIFASLLCEKAKQKLLDSINEKL